MDVHAQVVTHVVGAVVAGDLGRGEEDLLKHWKTSATTSRMHNVQSERLSVPSTLWVPLFQIPGGQGVTSEGG